MNVLDEYDEWQRAIGRTASTRATTRKVLSRFLAHADTSAATFTIKHAVAFLANEEFSTNTRYAYHWHLKTFAEWLVMSGYRSDSPMLGLPRPKAVKRPPRPVSSAGVSAILDHAPTGRVKMMVLLSALQGLRVHEVAKIHGKDIDLEPGTIEVEGKGGKIALLPLHDEVRRAMQAEHMPMNDFWFESYKRPGHPIQPASVSKAIGHAMASAGVPGTPHALRHFFGTELVRSGANLRVVQELMRHSSMATTQIYVEVQSTEMRNALGGLRIAA